MAERKIRIVIAKPGLDGHDRGAKVVARALRDAGMEVIYTGIRQTPEMIAEAALQEDADVVGLSILSGAHLDLFPRVMDACKERDIDPNETLFFCGGIIPVRGGVSVDVKRLQYTAVLITGALAGTAGAFLSMGYVSSFLRDMTAGRGFIAVAAIFLGGMRPLGVGVASLVFGFFAALSIRLGNADIPSQLVQAIPYLATLVGLGLFAWRESQRRQQFAVTEASRWDRLKRWRRGLTRV